MKKANQISITTIGEITVVAIDGEKVDSKDIVSMDIHIEAGRIMVTSTKVEYLKLGDA